MLILESLLERQEEIRTLLEDIDAGGSHFLGACSITRTLVLANTILEYHFSLLVSKAYSSTSRLAPALGPSGPGSQPGTSWDEKPPWDLALPTSRPAPAPGHPNPCSQPCWDPAPHQQVGSHHIKKGLAASWARGQPCLPVHP